MKPIVKRAGFVFDRTLDGMVAVATVILLTVTVLVSMDALGRYFFNHSFLWVTQVTEYSLLYITFLGAAWLLRREGHVCMEIVVSRLNKATRAVLGVISSVIGVFTYAIFTWYGTLVAWDHFQRGIYDPTLLRIPKAPIIAIIPIGSFFLAVQFIRGIRKYLDELQKQSKSR